MLSQLITCPFAGLVVKTRSQSGRGSTGEGNIVNRCKQFLVVFIVCYQWFLAQGNLLGNALQMDPPHTPLAFVPSCSLGKNAFEVVEYYPDINKHLFQHRHGGLDARQCVLGHIKILVLCMFRSFRILFCHEDFNPRAFISRSPG